MDDHISPVRRSLVAGGFALAALATIGYTYIAEASPKKGKSKQPVKPPQRKPSPPSQSVDAAVRTLIRSMYSSGTLEQGVERIAVVVSDLKTGEILVNYRGEEPMQMASLSKPLVAEVKFTDLTQKELLLDYQTMMRMRLMMTSDPKWDKSATTRAEALQKSNLTNNEFMDELGGPKATENILTKNYPGVFRHLRLMQKIPVTGPNNGTEYLNRASAMDYNRFLVAMHKRELALAHELKKLMHLPSPYGNKLVMGVEGIPQDTELYHKTGTTRQLCADIGTVVARGVDNRKYPYNLIILLDRETKGHEHWGREKGWAVLRPISSAVYKHMPYPLIRL